MVSIPKTSAHFATSLANKITAAAASMILVSGTDKAGNALSGLYGWVVDRGTASEEFMLGTISGTTVTITARGLDPGDGKTEVSSLKLPHRRGATVEITDYPLLAVLLRLLNGDESFANKLSYASHPSFSSNTELIDKKYADDLAIAGAPDSSDIVKGLVEQATQAEIEAGSASGGTTAPIVVQASRLGARLYYGYAADAGANDTYAITCAPAPTTYTAGMVFIFKANTANTGACTLNVNSLGAKALKVYGADPRDNYIAAGAIVICVYNGTVLNILSVSSQPQVSQDGAEVYAADAGGSDAYAITLTPAIAAYADGQVFRFKANTVNTAAATLAVNGLSAINILRPDGSALADGDIAANQVIEVIYRSGSFYLLSPVANSPKYTAGVATRDLSAASGSQTIAHGLGRAPRRVRVTGMYAGINQGSYISVGSYNGVNTAMVGTAQEGAAAAVVGDTTNIIKLGYDGGDYTANQVATISVDATNITLAWTKTGSPTGTAQILWEAEA